MANDGVMPRPESPKLSRVPVKDDLFRILCLDGGGAKGFYTLGVLKQLESTLGCPLYKYFDLIFGTSTGSIIASLLALGFEVDQIHELYREHVVKIVAARFKGAKSRALGRLTTQVYGTRKFDAFKTRIGIVAARWVSQKPMIFKAGVEQAHGLKGSFVPGFGCTIADAVQASCSAYPFFERKVVVTENGDEVELFDGGYCANNPTLYAVADALSALGKSQQQLRVVSIGVGEYPAPKMSWLAHRIREFWLVELLQKAFEVNTKSMDQLRAVLFPNVKAVRISEAFSQPHMATDLFEQDLRKLNVLWQRGGESFGTHETAIRELLHLGG